MAKKKFGKNISKLLYNGTEAEKSRYNTSGLFLSETVTDNNPFNSISSVKDLPKIKKEVYERKC